MAAWAKLSVPPLQTNPSVWINIDKAKTILCLCRSVTKLGSYFHGISEDCSRPGITWLKKDRVGTLPGFSGPGNTKQIPRWDKT